MSNPYFTPEFQGQLAQGWAGMARGFNDAYAAGQDRQLKAKQLEQQKEMELAKMRQDLGIHEEDMAWRRDRAAAEDERVRLETLLKYPGVFGTADAPDTTVEAPVMREAQPGVVKRKEKGYPLYRAPQGTTTQLPDTVIEGPAELQSMDVAPGYFSNLFSPEPVVGEGGVVDTPPMLERLFGAGNEPKKTYSRKRTVVPGQKLTVPPTAGQVAAAKAEHAARVKAAVEGPGTYVPPQSPYLLGTEQRVIPGAKGRAPAGDLIKGYEGLIPYMQERNRRTDELADQTQDLARQKMELAVKVAEAKQMQAQAAADAANAKSGRDDWVVVSRKTTDPVTYQQVEEVYLVNKVTQEKVDPFAGSGGGTGNKWADTFGTAPADALKGR